MKRKIGLSWEKTGLRFWTFSHHPSRHLSGGMDVWIIVILSTHSYIRHPGCNPWDHSPESYTVQKRKRHRQYFWLSESFFVFRGDFTPSQVELEGVEPSSKQVTDVLSTCLFRDWFSSRLRTRTPKACLIPKNFIGGTGPSTDYPVLTSTSESHTDGHGVWEMSCPRNCCGD